MFKSFRYGMTGGFSEAELLAVKDDALGLLADVGMGVDHDGMLAYLDSLVGVRVFGRRVRLSRDLVEAWLPRIRRENLCYSFSRPDHAWRLAPPYMASKYRDPESGEIRPCATEDLRFCAKLCDALGMYGPAPLHIQDGPLATRQLRTFKTCLENAREVGGWGPAIEARELEFIMELGKVSGRKPPYACMEIPISPMRLNVEQLGMIFDRRGRGDQFLGVVLGGGAAPMPGATAPLSFPAAIAQGLAEALGAYIVPQLIDDRIPGYCSFGGFLFNLRTMDTFHPYFPESVMYVGMIRQVTEFVLGRTLGFFFKPDFYRNPGKLLQMGVRGALDALSGARSVHVGAETGDVFSPLNAVLAADYVRHLGKLVEGLPLERGETTARDLIEPGLASGMYTDQESTLNYRTLYTMPRFLFNFDDHASLMEAAREEARRLVAEHDFEPPSDVRREMDRICASAERALAG